MLMAFKIYGDYEKWRSIAKLNADLLDENYRLEVGMMIKYKRPKDPFKWDPKGSPYLIKRGDTLQKVSYFAYQTYRRWVKIWKNNVPLIKAP